jgi:hypothetical protein
MAQTIPDLWPEIEQSQVIPPVAILREQAALLGKKTNHLLDGRVDTRVTIDGRFVHSFYIVAPALGDYTYKLFEVSHDENPYPVYGAALAASAGVILKPDLSVSLNTEQEFVDYVRTTLNLDNTKRVIGNLLAQIKALS